MPGIYFCHCLLWKCVEWQPSRSDHDLNHQPVNSWSLEAKAAKWINSYISFRFLVIYKNTVEFQKSSPWILCTHFDDAVFLMAGTKTKSRALWKNHQQYPWKHLDEDTGSMVKEINVDKLSRRELFTWAKWASFFIMLFGIMADQDFYQEFI